MKWLILIILVACGKHEEPKKLDYADSDGDQVLNYEEADYEKYVANFETYGKISGVLRVNIDNVKEIPFSNEVDLNSRTLDLLTANADRINTGDYFEEWSRLNLKEEKFLKDLKLLYYQASLYFEQKLDPADEIVLMIDKGSVSLGVWQQNMKITLSKEQLQHLSEKKASLAVKKKFRRSPIFDVDSDNTIQNKTYRVFVNDGETSKILYVSKNLEFEGLLKLLNIKARELVSEDVFFFNTHLPGETEWLYRHFKNGDRVLAFSDMDHLRTHILKHYHYQKKVVSRENGYTAQRLQLSNKPGAKVFLKVRSIQQTMQEFYTTQVRKRHGGGRDVGVWDCTHHLRHVKSGNSQSLHLTYLMEKFPVLAFNGADILEQTDNTGIFWELRLNSLSENAEIAILPLKPESYIVTGEYSNSCKDILITRGSYGVHMTNPEGKLSFEVESFVEKIQ